MTDNPTNLDDARASGHDERGPMSDVSRETDRIKNAVSKARPLSAGGRVSEYGPEHVELARAYVRMGISGADLARAFGIAEGTLIEWKNRYPEFRKVVETEKFSADSQVAAALFKKATGFVKTSKKAMQHEGQPVIAEYEEEVPPDTAAAFIWLKNRQPHLWRDRHEVTGADGQPLQVELSWLKSREVIDAEDIDDKNAPHLPEPSDKKPYESNT